MDEKEFNKVPQSRLQQNNDDSNRRDKERRKKTRDGFTYVTTVGWICRREKCRRKNDS